MLKNNFIKIKTKGCRKISYFESLGYDTSGDLININVNHLTIGSRQTVEVICDYCNREISTTYKEYIRNTSGSNKYACSKLCGSIKAKETNIKNIGLESHMMSKDIQEKAKKTNLEKYGVEFLQQSEVFKEKSKQTLLKKYGVDHISKTDYFKEEFKKTCLENNGSEYPMQSDLIKEKSKQTLLEKYGVDNPSKSIEIKEIIKIKNLERYGVDHTSKLEIVKEKVKNTKLEKYGNENYNNVNKLRETISKLTNEDKNTIINKIKNTKLEKYGNEKYNNSNMIKESLKSLSDYEWNKISSKRKKTLLNLYGVDNIQKLESYRKLNFDIANDYSYIKYLNNGISLFRCNKGHNFEISSDNFFQRNKSKLPLCTICYPISDQSSIKEKEVLRFISENYNGEIINGYRDGLEIDIFIPEFNIGFEFNGLYWHSEIYKDKNYHLDKTNFFKEKGIRIIHIWEDEWDYKNKIIKSQILNFLKLTNQKIFARSCEIKEIKRNDIIRNFLNSNHIQGYSPSIIKLGLFYGGDLVSLMTFDKKEGRKKLNHDEWNLSRFCNKLNTNVIGSASKLFKFFLKNVQNTRIISYADKSWSIGNLYYQLGFSNVNESLPDYKYLINDTRIHKQNYKKSNLHIIGDKTESEYMKSLGYYRIWDCGKIKFEIKRNT